MTTEKKKDSFAALFEKEARDLPRAKPVHVGDRLKATVIQVGREAIFVELEGKRQAWLDTEELRAPDGTIPFKVGDPIEAQVVEVDPSGEVKLGRTLGRAAGLPQIEQAKQSGVPIDGKVTGVNKGGLEVELGGGVRAFCPISQADNKFVQDPQALVGRTLRFAVTEVRDGGKSVVLSRRVVMEAEAREATDRALATLSEGSIVRGSVTSVREFGAFVDLGGIEGLIPASELSHERGVKPSDVVAAGDGVEVQVRRIEKVTPQRAGDATVKVTLSLKALAADPWDRIDGIAPEGTVVQGSVTRLADFGAFVKIASGVEGLLHVSEMGGSEARTLKVGQGIAVVVKKVDRAQRRIALVPAPEGAAAGTAVRAPSFDVGQTVRATVDRIETFGVFVQIEGTKGRAGRGLIPNAELGTARGSDTRKLFREGTAVTAKILETGEGRLRMSIKAVKDDEERAEFDGYRDRSAAPARLGTLGELLKQREKK